MSLVQLRYLPGQRDVNQEFSAKGIRNTLRDYKKLGKRYRFGDLSAKHCALDSKRAAAWRRLINGHYPPDVQLLLRTVIAQALSHTDSRGRSAPIPIEWDWAGRGGVVKVTYNHTAPKYKIEVGYPAPMGDKLAQRLKKVKGRK